MSKLRLPRCARNDKDWRGAGMTAWAKAHPTRLQDDILAKMNGCGEIGEPDKNDWIITCEEQNEIYPLIIETIEYVRGLMGD